MLVVVFGPQTRLAGALLNSSSWESETTFLLVARHLAEYEALKRSRPDTPVYRAWDPDSAVLPDVDAVVVLCCAFGPIHPGAAAAVDDVRRAEADYRALETIARQYSHVPLQVVLISSVLALCPRPRREYYAGWKNVAEGMVREAVHATGDTCLSVFYPGRLVERKTVSRPTSLLHTSYEALAEAVVSTVRQRRSRQAVLGLDSRVWLVLRCYGLVRSALTGRR